MEQRELAKALFGRSLRLVLAEWIVERDEAFFLSEAQDAMRLHGEAPSGVAKELRLFVQHGMLSEVPDQRRVYFIKLDSALWPVWAAAAAAIVGGGSSASQTEQRTDRQTSRSRTPSHR